MMAAGDVLDVLDGQFLGLAVPIACSATGLLHRIPTGPTFPSTVDKGGGVFSRLGHSSILAALVARAAQEVAVELSIAAPARLGVHQATRSALPGAPLAVQGALQGVDQYPIAVARCERSLSTFWTWSNSSWLTMAALRPRASWPSTLTAPLVSRWHPSPDIHSAILATIH